MKMVLYDREVAGGGRASKKLMIHAHGKKKGLVLCRALE
jgi:hypothetical protein